MLRDFLRILPIFVNTLSLEERVNCYNELVSLMADLLGIDHPVLRPKLVKVETLSPSDDTPAFIMQAETRVTELGIRKAGLTLPVVVCGNNIIDGVDRLMVCRNSRDVRSSLSGYVPIVEVEPATLLQQTLYNLPVDTLL